MYLKMYKSQRAASEHCDDDRNTHHNSKNY